MRAAHITGSSAEEKQQRGAESKRKGRGHETRINATQEIPVERSQKY